ncbi:hypothetical protein MNBD_GAMMA22-2935 [hydrothermal vent metagenome]|uniref:DUF302 domain-containing protein n=1 Tax=hydrothermal vent metagenome TaxID=652676 RepID=A0A3B1ADT3_9ZZZZ
MKILLYTLAVAGLFFLMLLVYLIIQFEPVYHALKKFDENAIAIYSPIVKKLIETGDITQALVSKEQVKEDLNIDDITSNIKAVTEKYNIKNAKGISTNKKGRMNTVYSYCDSFFVKDTINYNDVFAVIKPCQISLVEDKKGKLWLYGLNIDLLIYGGTPLTSDLKKELLILKSVTQDIIKLSAKQ